MDIEKEPGKEYFVAVDHLIDGLLLGLRNPYKYAAEKTEGISENKIRTMCKHPALDKIIKNKLTQILEASDIDKVEVLNELKKIAFSNIKDVLTVSTTTYEQPVDNEEDDEWADENEKKDKSKEKVAGGFTQVIYKDWAEMEDSVTAAVAEVSQSAQGIKIKLHSKMTALESLVKIFEMTKEKLELSGTLDTGQRLFDGYKPGENAGATAMAEAMKTEEEIDEDNPL